MNKITQKIIFMKYTFIFVLCLPGTWEHLPQGAYTFPNYSKPQPTSSTMAPLSPCPCPSNPTFLCFLFLLYKNNCQFLITTKVASFGGSTPCCWSEFCFLVVALSLSLSLSYLNQPLCEWGDSLLFVTLWLYLKQPFLSFLSSFLWWALDFSFGFPVITWELGCSNWIFCEVCCVWGLTWLRLTLKDWNLRVEEWGFGWELHVGGWCLCCFSVLWQVWDPWGTELIHGVMRYVYCVVIRFWLLCCYWF